MLLILFVLSIKFVISHSWTRNLGSNYKEEPIVPVAKIFYNETDKNCEFPMLKMYTSYHEETYPKPIEIEDPLEYCIKQLYKDQKYRPIEKCRPMPYESIYWYENKVVCFTCGKYNGFIFNQINYYTPIIGMCYYSREKPGFKVKYIPEKTHVIDNVLYILDW